MVSKSAAAHFDTQEYESFATLSIELNLNYLRIGSPGRIWSDQIDRRALCVCVSKGAEEPTKREVVGTSIDAERVCVS